jgi:hypothetical protein
MYNRYNDYAKLMSGELWEIVEKKVKKQREVEKCKNSKRQTKKAVCLIRPFLYIYHPDLYEKRILSQCYVVMI